MSCGYWLRINGAWVAIDGVQAGVGVEYARARSSFASVGGVPHSQAALRAPRTWNVPLGDLAGPEQVAALMVAAQGDAGDVMLWDESAARANMLDPVKVAPLDWYPVVMCGAMPLRSLSRGPSAAASVRDVRMKANVAISSTDAWDWPGVVAGTQDALFKVSVPVMPAGVTLSSAQLILQNASGSGSGTLTAKVAPNAWVETGGISPKPSSYWDNIPGGSTIGSAALGAASTAITLSGVPAYSGTDLTLRVSLAGSGGVAFNPRTFATGHPILRLNYSADLTDHVFVQHLMPGSYTLGFWSTAAANTQLGTMVVNPGGGQVVAQIRATAGTGLRYMAIPVVVPAAANVEFTLFDSVAYLLAGPMLSSVNHPGVYMAPQKTPVPAAVEDPSLSLASLYPGEQGMGQRSVVIREDG